MGKQARVRIWSGRRFWDFYTDNLGSEDWAVNKMMDMQDKDPGYIYERYEILHDDRRYGN